MTRLVNPHRAWLETWFEAEDPWNYGRGADIDRYRTALDALPSCTGSTLEVGCAEGHFSALLARRASRLVAIDLVAAAARRAAARTSDFGNVSIRVGDATRRLPVRRFDTVICMDVLYYVPTALLPAVRGRLARRVRPGGYLLLQHQVDDIVLGWDPEAGGAECLHPPFLGLGFDVVSTQRDETSETLLLQRHPASPITDAIGDLGDVAHEPWPAARPASDASWAHADLTTGEVLTDEGQGWRRRVILRAHGRPVAEATGRAPLDVTTLANDVVQTLETRLRPGQPRVVGDDTRTVPPGTSAVTVAVCTTGTTTGVDALLRELAGTFTCHIEENGDREPRLRDLAAELDATYRHEPRPGLSAARNRAMAAAATEWVLFLDDDVVLTPGRAARLAVALAPCLDDGAAGAVTGLVLPASLDHPADLEFEKYASHRRGNRRIDYRLTSSDDPRWPVLGSDRCGVGACLAVRRRAWKEVGGFDERLGPGTPARAADDDDFFRSLLEAGWSVRYEPTVAVAHRHRGDRPALRSQLHGYAVAHSAQLLLLALGRRDRGIARAWLRVGRERLQRLPDGPPDLGAAELAGHARGVLVALSCALRGRR